MPDNVQWSVMIAVGVHDSVWWRIMKVVVDSGQRAMEFHESGGCECQIVCGGAS